MSHEWRFWLCFRRVRRCGRTSVEAPTTAPVSVQESTAASTSPTPSLQPFKVKPNSWPMKLLLVKDCRSHAYWQQQFLHRMRDLHGHSDCVGWIQLHLPLVWGSRFLINVLQKFYVGPGQIQVRLSYDLENQFHTVLTLIYAPFGLYNTPMYSWGSGTRQTEQTNLIIQENIQNYELNTN